MLCFISMRIDTIVWVLYTRVMMRSFAYARMATKGGVIVENSMIRVLSRLAVRPRLPIVPTLVKIQTKNSRRLDSLKTHLYRNGSSTP